MAIDYATARGQVRLLITDTDEAQLLLTDEQVDAFLALEGQSVLRGAAMALETIASNETLVQKKTRLLDLQTDGPAVAADLRKHAATLRERADFDETTGAFDWAEMVTGPFGARERFRAEYERHAAG
jgi:hypothetical protein